MGRWGLYPHDPQRQSIWNLRDSLHVIIPSQGRARASINSKSLCHITMLTFCVYIVCILASFSHIRALHVSYSYQHSLKSLFTSIFLSFSFFSFLFSLFSFSFSFPFFFCFFFSFPCFLSFSSLMFIYFMFVHFPFLLYACIVSSSTDEISL